MLDACSQNQPVLDALKHRIWPAVDPRMAPAMVPSMCPNSGPALCKCPEQRLDLRRPAAAANARNCRKQSAPHNRPERAADCRRPQCQRQHPVGGTERPPVPHPRRRRNGNGIAGPGAFYYTGPIPSANRRRGPDRIIRSYTKCSLRLHRSARQGLSLVGAVAPFCIRLNYTE